MNTKKNILIIIMAVFLMGAGLPAVSSAVDVSVECTYDNPASNDLVCGVWADTTEVLRSGGVLVNYSPGILTYGSATKDPAWQFSSPGAPAGGWPYMEPEVDEVAGTIIVIVGIFDANDTNAGISGQAKVADITFTRNATPAPNTAGAAQAAFFGISAELGRPGPYVNFVNTAGDNLDNNPVPTFSAIAAERGDGNADGDFSVADYIVIRNNINSTVFPLYLDCNGDNSIDVGDYICVRNKI